MKIEELVNHSPGNRRSTSPAINSGVKDRDFGSGGGLNVNKLGSGTPEGTPEERQEPELFSDVNDEPAPVNVFVPIEPTKQSKKQDQKQSNTNARDNFKANVGMISRVPQNQIPNAPNTNSLQNPSNTHNTQSSPTVRDADSPGRSSYGISPGIPIYQPHLHKGQSQMFPQTNNNDGLNLKPVPIHGILNTLHQTLEGKGNDVSSFDSPEARNANKYQSSADYHGEKTARWGAESSKKSPYRYDSGPAGIGSGMLNGNVSRPSQSSVGGNALTLQGSLVNIASEPSKFRGKVDVYDNAKGERLGPSVGDKKDVKNSKFSQFFSGNGHSRNEGNASKLQKSDLSSNLTPEQDRRWREIQNRDPKGQVTSSSNYAFPEGQPGQTSGTSYKVMNQRLSFNGMPPIVEGHEPVSSSDFAMTSSGRKDPNSSRKQNANPMPNGMSNRMSNENENDNMFNGNEMFNGSSRNNESRNNASRTETPNASSGRKSQIESGRKSQSFNNFNDFNGFTESTPMKSDFSSPMRPSEAPRRSFGRSERRSDIGNYNTQNTQQSNLSFLVLNDMGLSFEIHV
jgi:hypothetical protein